MESFFTRFKNVLVLVAVLLAQTIALAIQVRRPIESGAPEGNKVTLIRYWVVTVATPFERFFLGFGRNVRGGWSNYVDLRHTRQQNHDLQNEIAQLRLEQAALAEDAMQGHRLQALLDFQHHYVATTVAAQVIGTSGTDLSRVLYIDKGSKDGLKPDQAVITPDGIAGKVTKVFAVSSFILLVTDQTFAAGVISQNNRVHGTFKGLGYEGSGKIEHVQNEQKIDQGEWFFTSGDDRIFPKGLPVGEVTMIHQGKTEKEIFVSLSGFKNGLEEVLIIVEGVHSSIPDASVTSQTVHLLAPPPSDAVSAVPAVQPMQTGSLSTDADRIKDQYRKLGEQQKHVYGERGNGAPNYNAPAKTEVKPDVKPDKP